MVAQGAKTMLNSVNSSSGVSWSKNHVYSVCSQRILGACSVSMRSFWLEQVEEHQIRVVEVVWTADAVCSCSVSGFSIAGRIQVLSSAGACRRT